MANLNSKPKKRISISKKLLRLAYRICDGNATNFDLMATVDHYNEAGRNKCWNSQCKYLDPGDGETGSFECELLKKREFEKLSDPNDARCTLSLLILLCDFYLKKYDHTKTKFVRPDEVKDRTPTIVPDYGGVLRRCKSTIWVYGNQPKKWYYFLCRCANNEAYNAGRNTMRCGTCQHFIPLKRFCVAQQQKVKAWDKSCRDEYDPTPIEASLMALASTSNVQDKIIERILYWFVLETKNNPREQKHEINLTIAEKLLTGDYQREKIAEYYNVSSKTIDRRKEEVVKLMKEYAENDPELLALREDFMELDNRPPDYGYQRKTIDKSLEDVESDEDIKDVESDEDIKDIKHEEDIE